VRALRDDPAQRRELSDRAQQTFRSEFVAENVYARLIERLEMIARTSNPLLGGSIAQYSLLSGVRN